MSWNRAWLEQQGFVGWVPFSSLPVVKPPALPGVYVVMRESTGVAEFLDVSPAGWFKARDPSVTPEVLKANWVAGAQVIYIGKATSLRSRLSQYRRHGEGKPVGHAGGRYIWQLADSSSQLVAWKATADEDPAGVESRLIADFRADYGMRPFANLKD